MSSYYKTDSFNLSRIIPLPFVNALPSNYDTIFTVLIEAASKAKSNNQKTCFVTFDQPLYFKAREILACIDVNNDTHNLGSIVVRLGGFHTLMPFLGAIGNIMEVSGLKEALCTIFAKNSCDKVLTGHAFSRSVRGHILTQAALGSVILSLLKLNDDEIYVMNYALNEFGEENFVNAVNDERVLQIRKKFNEFLEVLKKWSNVSAVGTIF